MITPLYKPFKKNGTTMYVFPSVEEDKNLEKQNENYTMRLSHFVLVNFPRQAGNKFDFENTFNQESTSIQPASFKDQLVESLRNYVANHESVIRNSKINNDTFYYDTFELETTTEKIFWKWCKELNIISHEVGDSTSDYFGADPKYADKGPVGNTDYFREYLWKERSNDIESVLNVVDGDQSGTLPAPNAGSAYVTITFQTTTTFQTNDKMLINKDGLDFTAYSTEQSELGIEYVYTTTTNNDTVVVLVPDTVSAADFTPFQDLEAYNSYNRFVQFISEIGGINNVQLPDKSYTETFAYISNQHGQTPYALWNVKNDNNYKPNLEFPILPIEIQAEIQGGENPNNPILISPTQYPGDIWGQFDTNSFTYTTQNGNSNKRNGFYYGVSAVSNIGLTETFPIFDGSTLDGLTLNLNINDYAKAVSYIYPIESFNEFAATSFDNIAPKDFEFNAILWYYTIEDVTNNNLNKATNLYGVEFLETPDNDIEQIKTKIPSIQKYVSNGAQDGNSYTFTLDTNVAIESDVAPNTFDPDKIYSLFGMELFYEALNRITYFNDKITTLVNTNISLKNEVDDLKGLVYNQETLTSIRSRMDNITNLLNVYSTLQIGDSDTIEAFLDTSVNPAVVRLNSVNKQYGYIYQYNTKEMYNETVNLNSLTNINKNEKIIPVVSGKDFLTIINNNDDTRPQFDYDTTIEQDELEITIEKDLFYKQKMDILILPKINNEVLNTTNLNNDPIHDKKINININFLDSNETINKFNIGKFNLPVTKFYNGVDYVSEPNTELDILPRFNVNNVYYSKETTNSRLFTFVVDGDLLNQEDVSDEAFVKSQSRIFLENLIFDSDPTAPENIFVDYSGQYEVFNDVANPKYKRSSVSDLDIISSGSGYTPGTNTATETITQGNATINITFEYVVDAGGQLQSIELLSSTGLTDKFLSSPITLTGGNNDATFKLISKDITEVSIAMDINSNVVISDILTNYDTITNINTKPNKTKSNINKHFKVLPVVTLFKGYKISIIRTSENDLTIAQFNERYNIKIDKL